MKHLDKITTLFLITADQWVKYIIITKQSSYSLFPFLTIVYRTNTGVTLGLFNHIPTLILANIQLIALYWICTLKTPNITKVLIFAGGMSNIIDRIIHHYVIDYIQLSLFSMQWPAIINLADLYITIGLICYLFYEKSSNTGILDQTRLQSE